MNSITIYETVTKSGSTVYYELYEEKGFSPIKSRISFSEYQEKIEKLQSRTDLIIYKSENCGIIKSISNNFVNSLICYEN